MGQAARDPQPTAIDRRRKTWRTITEPSSIEPLPDRETLDEVVFDYTRESRCKVCSVTEGKDTPHAEEVRALVDRMLVAGATYAAITHSVEALTDDWPKARRPSYHSIRRHQMRHLPADRLAVREILERRAREAGLRIAVGDGPIVTYAALLEVVRNRGFEAIAQGETVPTVGETIRAAEALHGLDRESGAALTAEELARQMREFVRIVQAHVDETDWDVIVGDMTAAIAAGTDPLRPEEKT